jgi:hypothetical protein
VNNALEFHDSTVAEVRVLSPGVVEVVFDRACIHCSTGTPGTSPGECHVGRVVFRLHKASLAGNPAEFRGRLIDGTLSVHGSSHSVVSLPFATNLASSLSLTLDSGAILEVRASIVKAAMVGGTTYVEPFTG